MAGPGDFQLPSITRLTPERVDFSEELRAAEASDRNTESIKKGVAGLVEGVGDALYSMGEKSAMAGAQADALHAQLQFNKDASDLAQQGKYTIKEGEADYSMGGPAGPPTKSIELDPSFQQSVEETTSNLSEKYKQYPKVQQFIYEQVGKFGADAHKQAYAKAYEKAGADLKASNSESLRLLAENGDGSYVAGNSIIDSDPTLTTSEKSTAKAEFKTAVDEQYVSKQAEKVLKSDGLAAALKVVGDEYDKRGGSDTQKFSLLSELSREDNEAERGAIQAVQQTVDQASKNKTSVLDALDKLNANAAYPAMMKFQTDKARVDEWVKPAFGLAENGNETLASQVLEQTMKDKGATDAQAKYANTIFKEHLADFDWKDQGSATDVLSKFVDVQSALLSGGNVSIQGAAEEINNLKLFGKAAGTWGKKSDAAALEYLIGLQGIQNRENRPNKPSDSATFTQDFTDIIGKSLDAQQDLALYMRIAGEYNTGKLSQTAFTKFATVLRKPFDKLTSDAFGELKSLYTDSKTGTVDTLELSKTFSDVIALREKSPNTSPADVTQMVKDAIVARNAEIGGQATSALNPSPQRPYQKFLGIVPNDAKNATKMWDAARSGALTRAVQAKGATQQDAKDLEMRMWNFAFSQPIPGVKGQADIHHDPYVDQRTGQYYLGWAEADGKYYAPDWDNASNQFVWKDVSK